MSSEIFNLGDGHSAEPMVDAQKQTRAGDAERRDEYLEQLETRFIILPMAILLDRQAGKLTPQDIYFYCYLLAKQGRNEYLWFGLDSLQLLTGLTKSVMKTALDRLEACGHIERKRQRSGTTRTYCKTLVTKDRRVLVRGVKVADAIKDDEESPAPSTSPNRFVGATSDRNSPVRPSRVEVDTMLN